MATKSEKIRELNDRFRQTFSGGQVVITSGVDALPVETKQKVLKAVQSFDKFDKGNDPHHEHDFGAFEIDGMKFFFKLSYYDLSMEYGSEDPADPTVTKRVLTVMLAEEY